MRSYVIGGNWKLQINSISKTRTVLGEMASLAESMDTSKIQLFLALPAATLFVGQEILQDSPITLAAQNAHSLPSGPFTGEVSVESLKDLGVSHVLVGHSERRLIFGESDEVISQKVNLVLEHDLTPVLCLGETAAQRQQGQFETIVDRQLSTALQGLSSSQVSRLILAYEPVWAINNPQLNPDADIKAASAAEAEAAHGFIRSWLGDHFDKQTAESIPVQYGGSMKPGNAEELLSQNNIDGGLIGGASLSADSFGAIARTAIDLS